MQCSTQRDAAGSQYSVGDREGGGVLGSVQVECAGRDLGSRVWGVGGPMIQRVLQCAAFVGPARSCQAGQHEAVAVEAVCCPTSRPVTASVADHGRRQDEWLVRPEHDCRHSLGRDTLTHLCLCLLCSILLGASTDIEAGHTWGPPK